MKKKRHPKRRDNRFGRNMKILRKIKKEGKCARCGDKHDLTFHHRIPQSKEFNVGNAGRLKVSVERLQRELKKCDLLCFHCHRLEHEEILDLPRGWKSSDFVSHTTTRDFVEVRVKHLPSHTVCIGKHRFSRMRAHDKAIRELGELL